MSHIWRSGGQKLEFKGKDVSMATFYISLKRWHHVWIISSWWLLFCFFFRHACYVTHNWTNSPVAFCFFTSESAAARFLFRLLAANKSTAEQRLALNIPIVFFWCSQISKVSSLLTEVEKRHTDAELTIVKRRVVVGVTFVWFAQPSGAFESLGSMNHLLLHQM